MGGVDIGNVRVGRKFVLFNSAKVAIEELSGLDVFTVVSHNPHTQETLCVSSYGTNNFKFGTKVIMVNL